MTAGLCIRGLLAPYGVPTTYPHCHHNGQWLYQVFNATAFPASIVEDPRIAFRVDHDRGQTTRGADIRLIRRHSGLYATVVLSGDDPLTATIAKARPRWRGLSICYATAGARTKIDWSGPIEYVVQVDRIIEASLVLDDAPAYPTWATDDRQDARRRIDAAEDAVLTGLYGSDYRNTRAMQWWIMPRQGPVCEEGLRAGDPKRAFLARIGHQHP